MIEKRQSVLGFFATGLPLLATIIVFVMIGLIVAEFAVIGIPNITWEFITDFPREMNTRGTGAGRLHTLLTSGIAANTTAIPRSTAMVSSPPAWPWA